MIPRAAVGSFAALPAPATPPPLRPVRIDFGDGECVPCRVKHQADFRHMLHSVRAAGVRRKGANGFPIYDSPLLRDLDDTDPSHDYIAWPVPADRPNAKV